MGDAGAYGIMFVILCAFGFLLLVCLAAAEELLGGRLPRPELPEEARVVPEPGRRWRECEPVSAIPAEGISTGQHQLTERPAVQPRSDA